MQDDLVSRNHGVAALADQLRLKHVTATELLSASSQRLEAVNKTINAIVTLNPHAESEAAASDRRLAAGKPRGPLEGIPVTVKDNLLAAGMRATWGSRVYKDLVPDTDELPVARLRAAGAVVIGKTNVPEFTVEGYTNNELFGVTRNPWHPELTPGGSSGGAVAAVAAGIGAAAIGTDGGGSIRRPAAFTGLVGLKPSMGRIARFGGFPRLLLDMEVVGPICRNVADARLLLRCLEGPDVKDLSSWLTVSRARTPGSRQRILYVPCIDDAPVDDEIDTSVAAAADTLSDLGHEVTAGPLPFSTEVLSEIWPEIAQVGIARMLQDIGAALTSVGHTARELAEAGRRVTAPRFASIVERIEMFRAQVARSFEGFDLILTPATAALPWPAEQPFPETIAGQPVGPRGHAIFSAWVNAAGLPGITLPCKPSSSGMPIGLQLVAPFGCDERLLDIAEVYEAATARGTAATVDGRA